MSNFTDPAYPEASGSVRPSVAEDAHTILVNKVSWGAIFAGVVVGLVVQVLLTMLGVGIGVATLDPGTGDNPAASAASDNRRNWPAPTCCSPRTRPAT